MDQVQIQVKWALLSRPQTEKTYEVSKGITVGEFLPAVLAGVSPEEVVVVYNGKPVALTEKMEINGTMELIPVLCGG